jgi:hypothetical protein
LTELYIEFWFWLKKIARRDLRLTQPLIEILALVEGNREMGFQVDSATYRILVMVKGDH